MRLAASPDDPNLLTLSRRGQRAVNRYRGRCKLNKTTPRDEELFVFFVHLRRFRTSSMYESRSLMSASSSSGTGIDGCSSAALS